MSLRAFILRSSFWINDFWKKSPVGRPYRNVRYIQSHSAEDGKSIRRKALDRLLEHAWKNSEYYAGFRGRYELADYPVMDKLSLTENYDSIAVRRKNIPGQCGDVFIQRTSGSTGVPFAIPQDSGKRNRRIAEIKFFGALVGFKSHEKLIQLRTWNQWQKKSSGQIKKENIVPFDIKRMGEDDLKELCELIISEKAVSLRGYASSFDRLSRVARKYDYRFPSLKIIVSTSEALEDDVRAAVKKSLGCDIVSQYANEECGILAQERVPTGDADNRMYFNWSGYYIEVLKIDRDEPAEYGEIGRIVVTDLYNYAFPLIRYDTGDTCILAEPDAFSFGYPVMAKLYGRRFDLTFTTDGDPVYPLAYGRVLKNYPSVLMWQFVQTGGKEYHLRLKLKTAGDSELDSIKQNILNIIGRDSELHIDMVDDIPVLKSGKRKPVVNEWNAQ